MLPELLREGEGVRGEEDDMELDAGRGRVAVFGADGELDEADRWDWRAGLGGPVEHECTTVFGDATGRTEEAGLASCRGSGIQRSTLPTKTRWRCSRPAIQTSVPKQ